MSGKDQAHEETFDMESKDQECDGKSESIKTRTLVQEEGCHESDTDTNKELKIRKVSFLTGFGFSLLMASGRKTI